MVRTLLILTPLALCIFSGVASAGQLKSNDGSLASDFSSRQRCVCSTGYRSAHVVRYRQYRTRSAYLIGYDPLPYRYGSTFVWERPYRYYR